MDNEVSGNTAGIAGGGIRFCYFYGPRPRPIVLRNRILHNSAPEGAGIKCEEVDFLAIQECVIHGNDAGQRGGGLMVQDQNTSMVNLWGCTFDGNSAPEFVYPPQGGGVCVGAGNVGAVNTIVSSNRGGGLVNYGRALGSDYCDVWNNGTDYYNCPIGLHSISADPRYCAAPPAAGASGRDIEPVPWYCIYEDSPCNGTGQGGYDTGAGWVACYSVPNVVFYDNFSDQNDQGWIRGGGVAGQIQVEEGEYSMEVTDTQVESYVADLDVDAIEYRVRMRSPSTVEERGATVFFFRMSPAAPVPSWYEIGVPADNQPAYLARFAGGIGVLLAEFWCPPEGELRVKAVAGHLTGEWHYQDMIVWLFDVIDRTPLPSGTVGLGVIGWPGGSANMARRVGFAGEGLQGERGFKHTHFDNVMVRNLAASSVEDDVILSDGLVPGSGWSLRAEPVPNPSTGSVVFRISYANGSALSPAAVQPGRSGTISSVQLGIFDVQGRLVRRILSPGAAGDGYGFLWDGLDASGRPVPSSTYFWRVQAGEARAEGRVLLIR